MRYYETSKKLKNPRKPAMNQPIQPILARSLLLACALTLGLPGQAAVTTTTAASSKAGSKTTVKKGSSKKVAPPPLAVDDDVPDTKDAQQVEFNCEFGYKLAIFSKAEEPGHITLRWQQKLLRLTRVTTTTGAERFESLKHGLAWIGIPAKGILLDTNKGRQLANECKNAEQMKPPAPASLTAAPEGAASSPSSTTPGPTPTSTTTTIGN
jgi:hypothetical protein